MLNPRLSSTLAAAALTAAWQLSAPAATLDFNTPDLVVGSGPNTAGFIIDFNDGPNPLNEARRTYRVNWSTPGYTITDLFFDVVAADDDLFAKVGTAGSYGTPLFGIGYDLDGDGFGIEDASTFDVDGVFVTIDANADGASVTDVDDTYQEGWYTGYWSQWNGAANPLDPQVGWSPGLGLTSDAVSDGAWYGLGFDQDFSAFGGDLTDAPAFVPTPMGAAGGLIGIALIAARRRRA